MVDSLGIIEAELTRAREAHNEALAALQRNGAPIYADAIMREKQTAARQQLTAALDRLYARAAAIHDAAEATAAAGREDPYSWLTDEELHRAALLRPFVAEDAAAAGGAAELAQLGNMVMTGKRKPSRPLAWLLMRAAAAVDGVPSSTMRAFEAAAMPEAIAAAAAEAEKAERLAKLIDRTRPEYQERIMTHLVPGQHNYSHTGKPV